MPLDSHSFAQRRRLTRSGLLVAAGGGAAAMATSRLGVPAASATRFTDRRVPDGLFALGVASGDPDPDGVVIWTRLAPDPLNGGGMPPRRVPVHWEVATDESMRRVVRRGSRIADPDAAHAVHVEVDGLRPDHWYWYRFRVGSQESPIGRTRTTPGWFAQPDRFRFAFVSCQDWQNGYYPAYANLAREELDLVVHLGDYIYECEALPGGPRQHVGPEVSSLESYRNRHAQYRTDPQLQAAHAAFPWMVTWDDHEVENNYADAIFEDPAISPQDFLARRANAYQAYYEHMPLRRSSMPVGPDARLYRRLAFGRLAEISLLDTRQYRTDQPCGDGLNVRCAAALDEAATMTGPEQERWLLDGLDRSRARWNVIAQQTILAQVDFDPRPAPYDVFNLDQWDGYVAARNRLLGFLLHRRPSNPVVITGDIHSSWANELKADFANPASQTVGVELVGTSISSDFPAQFIAPVQAALPANPHVRFFDGVHRGYVRCDVDRRRWQSDFRAVPTILDPDAQAFTLKTAVIEDGVPALDLA